MYLRHDAQPPAPVEAAADLKGLVTTRETRIDPGLLVSDARE